MEHKSELLPMSTKSVAHQLSSGVRAHGLTMPSLFNIALMLTRMANHVIVVHAPCLRPTTVSRIAQRCRVGAFSPAQSDQVNTPEHSSTSLLSSFCLPSMPGFVELAAASPSTAVCTGGILPRDFTSISEIITMRSTHKHKHHTHTHTHTHAHAPRPTPMPVPGAAPEGRRAGP